jgi:hypothetical protein
MLFVYLHILWFASGTCRAWSTIPIAFVQRFTS